VRWKSTVFVFAVLALCFLLPMGSADATDPLDPEEYDITIPGHDRHEVLRASIHNGESFTWDIYFTNYTAHHLDLQFVVYSEDRKVTFSDMENMTINARRDGGDPVTKRLDFTVYVDEITATTYDSRVFMSIRITDVETGAFDLIPIAFAVDIHSSYDIAGNYNKFFGFIPNTLPYPFSSPVVPFIVTLIGILLAAYAAVKIVIPALGMRFGEELETVGRKRAETLMSLAVMIIAVILFIDPGLRIMGADLDSILLAEDVAISILVILAAIVIWKIYITAVELILNKIGDDEETEWVPSLMPVFAFVGKTVLIVGSLAIILYVFGYDLGAILVSAGFVTLGIMIGARKVLTQLFSGITIILTRRFKANDMVVIRGRPYVVKKVRLMYTEFTVMTKDRIVTMPNSIAAKGVLANRSFGRMMRPPMTVKVKVPYGADLRKVEEIMLEVTKSFEHIVQEPHKPSVMLTDYEDGGVEMTMEFVTARMVKTTDVKKAIYVRLAEEGIEMPLKRIDVYLVKDMEGGETI